MIEIGVLHNPRRYRSLSNRNLERIGLPVNRGDLPPNNRWPL